MRLISTRPAAFALASVSVLLLCGIYASNMIDAGPTDVVNGAKAQDPTHHLALWATLQQRGSQSSPSHIRRLQLKNFSLMRGPSEPMPQRVGTHVTATMGAPSDSLDLSHAQVAPIRNGHIWIVSSRDLTVTCILQGNLGSLSCDTASTVAARGLVLGLAKPPQREGQTTHNFYALGIVPDWVKVVKVRLGDKGKRNVIVSGNTFITPHAAHVPVLISLFCNEEGQRCRRI
jgi:hypothetical protein